MRTLYPAAALILMLSGSFSVSKTRSVTNASRRAADSIDLPESYKSRHFLSGDGGMTYDAAAIPGNIVKYDAASSGYDIMTMKAIIKGNKPAIAQTPPNGVIYQGQVTSTSSFNGSYVINGLKAENGQVIDLEIRDDAVYSVPPGQIDTAALRKAAASIAPGERKNYYYVTDATLTILSYRFHAAENLVDKVSKKAGQVNQKLDDLSHNDTAKNGVYLKMKKRPKTKMPQSPYSASNTKMLTDKALSVQLIPVDDIINATGKK